MFDLKLVGQFLQTALGKLTIKNALVPLLWSCAIITPVCFYAAWEFRWYDRLITVWLLRLAAAPPLVTMVLALGWGILKPSLLQSEEFQTREHSLQLLQGRRPHEVIDVNAVLALASAQPVANPALRPQPAELPAAPDASVLAAPQVREAVLVEPNPEEAAAVPASRRSSL